MLPRFKALGASALQPPASLPLQQSMEFLGNAIREVNHPTKARPDSAFAGLDTCADGDVEIFALPLARDMLVVWRRLVLRALFARQLAMAQTAFLELVDLEPANTAKEDRARDRIYIQASEYMTITRVQIFMRGELAPSKNTKQHLGPKEHCQHRDLIKRGNGKALWHTCKACGRRWPRVAGELIVSERINIPDEI